MPKRLIAHLRDAKSQSKRQHSKPSSKVAGRAEEAKSVNRIKSAAVFEFADFKDSIIGKLEEKGESKNGLNIGVQGATLDCTELKSPLSQDDAKSEYTKTMVKHYSRKNTLKPERFLSPKNKREHTQDEKKDSQTISKNKQRKTLKLPIFTKQDNQKIIRNAIINACLAGEGNKKRREEALKDFKAVPKGKNVILLFKDPSGARLDIKAVYLYNEEAEVGEFLYGAKDSPAILGRSMVGSYYRYDCGSKNFRMLQGNKNLSIAVDAVTIKAPAKKKSIICKR
eukprot:TRINITY_DN2713_c0_g2_i1.p1 TRINITY_DN2713_c0_g2~~TRINITY_DN2713_c0_g2_i1.p1  ORF type:complete len:282 (-),score=45.59 TRINITY_DN2713_c0_g2_i1:101-946(-)